MRNFLTIIFFIGSTRLIGQQTQSNPNWTDTTFFLVKLQDTSVDKKIVVINIGQKAVIYIKRELLRQTAVEQLNDFNRKDVSKIIHLLDLKYFENDTANIDQYLPDFDHIVSMQLQNGNAKILYNKTKSYITTISHRLEKYGMYAHRFFYLPDKRPFFATLEYSGIIENNRYHSDSNELVALGEKLASLRLE